MTTMTTTTISAHHDIVHALTTRPLIKRPPRSYTVVPITAEEGAHFDAREIIRALTEAHGDLDFKIESRADGDDVETDDGTCYYSGIVLTYSYSTADAAEAGFSNDGDVIGVTVAETMAKLGWAFDNSDYTGTDQHGRAYLWGSFERRVRTATVKQFTGAPAWVNVDGDAWADLVRSYVEPRTPLFYVHDDGEIVRLFVAVYSADEHHTPGVYWSEPMGNRRIHRYDVPAPLAALLEAAWAWAAEQFTGDKLTP